MNKWWKSRILLFLGLLCSMNLIAQQKVWVFLGNKGPEAAQFAAHPEAFLSPRALQHRQQAGIALTDADLPVSATYIQQLAEAGIKIHGKSRWINALSIESTQSLSELQAICPAITSKRPVGKFVKAGAAEAPGLQQQTGIDSLSYGSANFQINQLGLRCLHDRGFTGAGILIAIFDAGFRNMDTLAAFDSLWIQNRVLTYYDFVNRDSTVFDEHNHGENVASVILTNLPGRMIGAAPQATVALARTENVSSETHQEEDNWLMAAEWADSLGADVIQSSLGYSTFDPGEGDYQYSDLDGNTTIISRAADMAAARGILVVNSAGNEGTSPWRRITPPCDGDSVLCVGAVDTQGNYVGFSGVGPSADGRVKPDVVALGLGTTVVSATGAVGGASGTSFATPLIAGLSVCLRQAHPLRNNMDVIHAIQQSASQYSSPDSLRGYGLPNACVADSLLSVQDSLQLSAVAQASGRRWVLIYPNPATESIVVESLAANNPLQSYRILSISGIEVAAVEKVDTESRLKATIKIDGLEAGLYFLQIKLGNGDIQIARFVKE